MGAVEEEEVWGLEEEATVEVAGAAKGSARTQRTSLHTKRPKCSHNTSVAMVLLLSLRSRTTSPSSLLSLPRWAPPSTLLG